MKRIFFKSKEEIRNIPNVTECNGHFMIGVDSNLFVTKIELEYTVTRKTDGVPVIYKGTECYKIDEGNIPIPCCFVSHLGEE